MESNTIAVCKRREQGLSLSALLEHFNCRSLLDDTTPGF